MNNAEILEKAAELIESTDLIKGQLWLVGRRDSDHENDQVLGYCLSGAIHAALGVDPTIKDWYMQKFPSQEEVAPLARVLTTSLWGNPERGMYELVIWNNEDERTKEEVVDLLKKGAADVRSANAAVDS